MNSIISGTGPRARFCVPLLLAAFISACTIQAACNLQNNSGSDLTIVRSRDGEQEQRIHFKAGSSILLRDWLFWSYTVARGDKVLRYVADDPNDEFVVFQGLGPWTKRVFNAQLEPDGRIFVLSPGQAFPAKDFVEQPTGFPLAPH